MNKDMDLLPYNVSMRKSLIKNYSINIYDRFPYDNPYYIADKIVKANIGKSYDLAFSYFLKKTKQYINNYGKQHLTEIFNNKVKNYEHWRYSSEYFIDDKGLIQINPKYNEYYRYINFKPSEYIFLFGEKIIVKFPYFGHYLHKRFKKEYKKFFKKYNSYNIPVSDTEFRLLLSKKYDEFLELRNKKINTLNKEAKLVLTQILSNYDYEKEYKRY